MKTLRLYCESVGCKKTFRNQAGLDSHIMQDHRNNNYTLENEFKCPTCFKILSTKQSLKEHLYTHTGEKPYRCPEPGCGLYFRQSSQLSNHKKVHLEIKKNMPELSKINLALLSKLLTRSESLNCVVPNGPLGYNDVKLPELNPEPNVKLPIIKELLNTP